MSQQLQLRRNTAPDIAVFTGAQGEVVVDTTNNRVVVQDAVTSGGWSAAKLNDVSRLSLLVRGVNLNPTNEVGAPAPDTDTVIAISLPQGMSIYRIVEVVVGNPSAIPSGSVRVGIFTAALQGGIAIVAEQALSGITTISQNTTGNAMTLTLSLPSITTFNAPSLFLNVGAVNGAALTADFNIVIAPLS
jgi:hypothetical protein